MKWMRRVFAVDGLQWAVIGLLTMALWATGCGDSSSSGENPPDDSSDPDAASVEDVSTDEDADASEDSTDDTADTGDNDAEQDATPGDTEEDGEDDPDTEEPASPVPTELWTYLETAQSALRDSPDHLTARAAEVVQTGDPELIYLFVRDSIDITPLDDGQWLGSFDRGSARFGSRGALRYGLGTIYDKARLLVDLLNEAGFDAKVGRRKLGDGEAEIIGTYFVRRPWPDFEPSLSAEDSEALRGRLDLDLPSDTDDIDVDSSDLATLTAAMDAELSTVSTGGSAFVPAVDGDLPTVELTDSGSGEVTVLDVIVPDAEFGEVSGEIVSSGTINPGIDDITVELRGYDALGDMQVLAVVEWPEPEIIGRGIRFGLAPAAPPSQALFSELEALTAFVPIIAMERDSETPEELETLVAGATWTFTGDVIRPILADEGDEPTGYTVNGFAVEAGPNVDTSTIETIEATAQIGSFPEVRVDLSPLDSEGDFVAGLTSAAFEVTDEGERVSYTLRQNTDAPRIQVQYDTSGSMPFDITIAWEDTLLPAIVDGILAEHPNALIDLVEAGSDIWYFAQKGMAAGPTALIIITDGEANDNYEPWMETALTTGPAPLLIGVDDDELPKGLAKMAEVTGGTTAVVQTGEQVVSEVIAFAAGIEGGEAVLAYRAPGGDPGEQRTIAIRTPEGVEGTATYTVPAFEDRAPPNWLVGLELYVGRVGRNATRLLAGTNDPNNLPREELADAAIAVQATLTDRNLLVLEGAAPTPSQALDEHIGALLSTRAFFDAAPEDSEEFDALFFDGLGVWPSERLGVFSRLLQPDVATGVTFPLGLRGAVFRDRVLVDSEDSFRRRSSLDLLPMSEFVTLGIEDPEERHRATLRATAALGLVEGALFENSAAGDVGLTGFTFCARNVNCAFSPRGLEDEPAALQLDELLNDDWWGYDRFIRIGGAIPLGFWAVDKDSGEANAILIDATGGGYSEVQEVMKIARVIKATNLLSMGIAGANFALGGGPGIGAVNQIGKTVANAFAGAGIIIATISAAYQDQLAQDTIFAAACAATNEIKIFPLGLGPDPIRNWAKATLSNLWDSPCQ